MITKLPKHSPFYDAYDKERALVDAAIAQAACIAAKRVSLKQAFSVIGHRQEQRKAA